MSASEEDVAAILVAHLEALGADVYQEVSVSGGVADIVAVVHAETWIVEVKTSLSLALVIQAMERRRLAHRVYIAAPHTRNMRDVEMLCRELGVGLLEVRMGTTGSNWDTPKVNERCPSKRWNKQPVKLREKLRPEHKTHAKAGAVGAAGRWTPWRDTIEQLTRTVRASPGITIREAVSIIKHHYSTPACARSSLAKWITDGAVPGVRFERGDVIRLYPVE